MNNGYEHALQYQLFLCAYPHGKHVMPLACERIITCRVRAFTLFPEIPWRVTLDGSCWFRYGHVTVLFVTLIGQNLLLALTHAIYSLSEKLIAKRGFITLGPKVIMH